MAKRRNPTGLSGILALDKPANMSSHDVVNTVRRLTGERRVGHTGTLDPLATGLLLVCVGPATRLADYFMAGTKTYEARICFGRATSTDDAEGETVQECSLPSRLKDASYASEVLAAMPGAFEQMPPRYSAIKKEGITAYKAARAGKQLALEPRPVELHDATVMATGADYWDVRLTVSKGFYVRSFAR
ncbi:MAG: tRNA pseudouridine(55) synthase TruB, partial [Coriobacteriales bacterium]|nr:tRNA pseudouridine(55) synthase TruB [Coriobacteriales bacterium]